MVACVKLERAESESWTRTAGVGGGEGQYSSTRKTVAYSRVDTYTCYVEFVD